MICEDTFARPMGYSSAPEIGRRLPKLHCPDGDREFCGQRHEACPKSAYIFRTTD